MRTIGRWPWKSASGKKRVTTYLWNSAAPKIDGAYASADAHLEVGGRAGAAEGVPRGTVEAPAAQILVVVATIRLGRRRPRRRRFPPRCASVGGEPVLSDGADAGAKEKRGAVPAPPCCAATRLRLPTGAAVRCRASFPAERARVPGDGSAGARHAPPRACGLRRRRAPVKRQPCRQGDRTDNRDRSPR